MAEYKYLHIAIKYNCPEVAKELTFNITYKNESNRNLHVEIKVYEFGTENVITTLSKDVRANSEATDSFTFTPSKLPFLMAFDVKTDDRLDTFVHEIRGEVRPCTPEIKVDIGFGIPIE